MKTLRFAAKLAAAAVLGNMAGLAASFGAVYLADKFGVEGVALTAAVVLSYGLALVLTANNVLECLGE